MLLLFLSYFRQTCMLALYLLSSLWTGVSTGLCCYYFSPISGRPVCWHYIYWAVFELEYLLVYVVTISLLFQADLYAGTIFIEQSLNSSIYWSMLLLFLSYFRQTCMLAQYLLSSLWTGVSTGLCCYYFSTPISGRPVCWRYIYWAVFELEYLLVYVVTISLLLFQADLYAGAIFIEQSLNWSIYWSMLLLFLYSYFRQTCMLALYLLSSLWTGVSTGLCCYYFSTPISGRPVCWRYIYWAVFELEYLLVYVVTISLLLFQADLYAGTIFIEQSLNWSIYWSMLLLFLYSYFRQTCMLALYLLSSLWTGVSTGLCCYYFSTPISGRPVCWHYIYWAVFELEYLLVYVVTISLLLFQADLYAGAIFIEQSLNWSIYWSVLLLFLYSYFRQTCMLALYLLSSLWTGVSTGLCCYYFSTPISGRPVCWRYIYWAVFELEYLLVYLLFLYSYFRQTCMLALYLLSSLWTRVSTGLCCYYFSTPISGRPVCWHYIYWAVFELEYLLVYVVTISLLFQADLYAGTIFIEQSLNWSIYWSILLLFLYSYFRQTCMLVLYLLSSLWTGVSTGLCCYCWALLQYLPSQVTRMLVDKGILWHKMWIYKYQTRFYYSPALKKGSYTGFALSFRNSVILS